MYTIIGGHKISGSSGLDMREISESYRNDACFAVQRYKGGNEVCLNFRISLTYL